MFKARINLPNRSRECLFSFSLLSFILLASAAHANLVEERLDGFGGSGGGTSFGGDSNIGTGYSNYAARDFFLSAPPHHVRFDTEDPMFFEAATDLTSRTVLSGGNRALSLAQSFSYGVNGNMVFSGNISLQNNYHDDRDSGLSDIGLMIMYRAPDTGRVKTDVFGGINFTGGGATNLPTNTSTVYVTGARLGRQWVGITLAGTVQASWIFDAEEGMAYIDLMPEMYFRFNYGWSLGTNVVFRKATDPVFDQRWAGTKIAKRYGRTVYVGTFDYEFENSEWKVGTRVNLLF
jgi:hypothetical protein